MTTMIMRLSQSRDGVFFAARSVTDKLMLGLLALFSIAGIAIGYSQGQLTLAAGAALLSIAPLALAHRVAVGQVAARMVAALAVVLLALALLQLSGGAVWARLAALALVMMLLGYCDQKVVLVAAFGWLFGDAVWAQQHGVAGGVIAAQLAVALVLTGVLTFLCYMLTTVLMRAQIGAEFARNVRDGKLDFPFSAKDIARSPMIAAMDAMQGDLRGTIGVAASSAREVADAAAELAAASARISSGVHLQADASAGAGNVANDMELTVSTIAERAAEAAKAAARSREAARNGGEVISEAADAMRRMAEAVEAASASVETLGAKSDAVGQVVQMIKTVAEQTNLLALNAAIEAARAGEAGRGFAVVADEVRKLSEQTNRATGDITRMVGEIIAVKDDVTERMSHAVEQVESGLSNAERASSAIEAILRRASRVDENIAGIEEALRTQREAAHSVAAAVARLSVGAAEASGESEGIANRSQQLAQTAQDLHGAVKRFAT
jgi:methyl-accepting chemotaxis protein